MKPLWILRGFAKPLHRGCFVKLLYGGPYKALIQRELHKVPMGFIHPYRQIFQSFFPTDMGGCFAKPLYRRSFTKPLGAS